MEAFAYQVEGANFLAGRKRALLFDDPGLGKTFQSILAADKAGIENRSITCPASVVTQWRREHTKLAESLHSPSVASYEHARDKGLPRTMGLALFDEIHYLRGAASRRSIRILGVKSYGADGFIDRADRVWGLSGSPMPNNPLDLYPIMLGIVPGSLWLPRTKRTMEYYQFMNHFCDVYQHPTYGPMVRKAKNLDELRDRLAPYMLRRTKKQVRKDYKEPLLAELWLDAGSAADKMRKLDQTPEGLAIAEAFKRGGFVALRELAEYGATYRRYTGLMKVEPVAEWLCGQFDGGMDKIVVVCVHREVIDGLREKLERQKIPAYVYWGGLTEKQKDSVKKAFIQSDKGGVLLLQITAGGTGLDGLQHATGRMLLAEWSWIDDDNIQVISRIDRIGQEDPVLGQFAGLEGSLDGAIMAAARRRAAQNKQLFH